MIESLGKRILSLAETAGEMLLLFFKTVYYFKEAPRNFPAIFRQLHDIGIGTFRNNFV